MRYLNWFLCILMILFAAVQYNDPDAPVWAAIYGVAAFWAGFAAYRPSRLRQTLPTLALAACLLLALVGTAYLWPTDAGWWRREVWWQSETAREGMGLMLVTATLLIVAVTWSLAGRRLRRQAEV